MALRSVGPDFPQCGSIAPSHPPGLPPCRSAPAPPSSLIVLRLLLRCPSDSGPELLSDSQSTMLQKGG